MMCSPLHITANCMFHFHPLTFIEFRRVGSGRHEHRRGHARDFKETMPSEELHGEELFENVGIHNPCTSYHDLFIQSRMNLSLISAEFSATITRPAQSQSCTL